MVERTAEFAITRCGEFIDATKDRPTPPLICEAIDLAVQAGGRRALELGCGAGVHAAEMMGRGLDVTAVDLHPAALEAAEKLAAECGLAGRLTTFRGGFEEFDFTGEAFDLVNARFSIIFCGPPEFAAVWESIRRSLRPGGVFTGQLLGPHDSFLDKAEDQPICCHRRSEVEALLDGLIIHRLEEIEKDGYTVFGTRKHWHVYHILAQRPQGKPNAAARDSAGA